MTNQLQFIIIIIIIIIIHHGITNYRIPRAVTKSIRELQRYKCSIRSSIKKFPELEYSTVMVGHMTTLT